LDRRAFFFLWHPGDNFEPRCLVPGHAGELGVQAKDKQGEGAGSVEGTVLQGDKGNKEQHAQ